MRGSGARAADTARRLTPALLASAALWCAAPAVAEDIGHNLEALVGTIAAELMAREYGTLDDPLLTEWVDEVGGRVARPCPRQEFPFRFRILDTPEVNAFSLPGAHIFVTRGLLARVQSEDELGGVLAHEVGHVADRDFQRVVTRQLLFLGLGEALDRTDQKEWLPALGAVQVLNTLRHSRRQEDEADLRGVEYALAARYDPLAMTGFHDMFLGGRNRPRPWYRGVLQTHPDPYKRRARCVERTRRFGAADPEALAAVAEDLKSRSRYSAALRIEGLRAEVSPEDVRPLLGEAEIRLRRGEREGCVRACRRALLLAPEDPAALDLAQRAAALPSAPPPPAEPAAAPAETGLDREAVGRLAHLARDLETDRRFNNALTWAQAYRPEVADWRWMLLATRVQVLLTATDRLRWRVSEVNGLASGGATAWASLTPPPDRSLAEQAIASYNRAVARATKAGEELRLAMQLLPTVLASLVLMGNGDPFGRVTSTRFALLEGDLLLVEEQVRSALEHSRVAAREVALAETDRYTCELDAMEASAGEAQRGIYHGLAATRFRMTPEEVRDRSATEGGLGHGCRTIVAGRAGAGRERRDSTYEQAEAERIALRLLTCEAKAETIRTADVQRE